MVKTRAKPPTTAVAAAAAATAAEQKEKTQIISFNNFIALIMVCTALLGAVCLTLLKCWLRTRARTHTIAHCILTNHVIIQCEMV